jgi:DNA transformation protein
MRKIKGDRLFVNLGASQVRRRLRGFGHGVRKVESAGRNQAIIIHTATGAHLRELESLFAEQPHGLSADKSLAEVEEE